MVILPLQEDMGTEESNDAEIEAPEGTLDAPDASEVTHATFSANKCQNTGNGRKHHRD